MTNSSTYLESKSWEDFLTFIREKLENDDRETEYYNWIEPITLLSESADELKLEMPNVFLHEYFIENYEEALTMFTQKKPSCSIKSVAPKSSPLNGEKERSNYTSFGLCPHYSFDNFIEGPSNQFVKSAAVGIAVNPSNGFNPLVIHGGVGLGKTHLLHAIGHLTLQKHANIRIKYITTESFVNDLVKSLKQHSMDKAKQTYRSLDVLLIDDIQFLQKKPHFEEEFCNTLETLIQARKQVVITSDFPPTSLQLSERMVDRMKGGLIAQISSPDLETRMTITKVKAKHKGLLIEESIMQFIAENISQNVRQLEGAINKLLAYQALLNQSVTIELTKQLLNPMFADKIVDVKQIIDCVSKILSVKASDIRGNSRKKRIAEARQIAMFLAKELLRESLGAIANEFGGKTHSTLIHAWKKITQKRTKDNNLNQCIECLFKELQH